MASSSILGWPALTCESLKGPVYSGKLNMSGDGLTWRPSGRKQPWALWAAPCPGKTGWLPVNCLEELLGCSGSWTLPRNTPEECKFAWGFWNDWTLNRSDTLFCAWKIQFDTLPLSQLEHVSTITFRSLIAGQTDHWLYDQASMAWVLVEVEGGRNAVSGWHRPW